MCLYANKNVETHYMRLLIFYFVNSVSYITLPTWLMAFALSLLEFTENDIKPCSEAWNLLYGIPAVTGAPNPRLK